MRGLPLCCLSRPGGRHQFPSPASCHSRLGRECHFQSRRESHRSLSRNAFAYGGNAKACACSGGVRFPVGCPTQRCPAPKRGVLPPSRYVRLGRGRPELLSGHGVPQPGWACFPTSRQETRGDWSRAASAWDGSERQGIGGRCAHFLVCHAALRGPAPEKGGQPHSCFPQPGHGCL